MTETTVRAVVVFGSTGFAGRHLCAAFEATGHRVVRVSRRETGRDGIALDLAAASPAAIAGLLAATKPDVVINSVGAVWGVTEDQMTLLNAELPAKLAEVAASLPRPPRVVHLGSVHEYGPVAPGVTASEQLAPRPDSGYGRTKLAGTRALLAAARDGLPEVVVLRVSNILGRGAPPDSLPGTVAHHLAAARAEVAAGRPAPALRLSPLMSFRDFVDVRDVCDAVLHSARGVPGGAPGTVLNVARGEAVAVRELVHRMVELSGIPVEVVEERACDSVRGTISGQRYDISAAHRALGWRPRRPLDVTLRDMLRRPVAR
ncbi:NAD(P)-dependent oxidoreductase [Streptomyces sp. ICBB 8177]|uniref:NAD-dependent epimerase/dehydratase family protein n=1 Tax=Streptomyces sp. ICBB 8177 TaxID=563922 RepID=UPI0013053BE7|nr:NAD(P)-dependent oxidoreductase [Streptomyces sp. ICBB 8177]